MSSSTSPAMVNPKMPVMCAMVPFICALERLQSWFTSDGSPGPSPVASPMPQAESCPLFSRSSSLYTHWNLCAGFSLARFSYLRNAAPSGHPRTFQNSATRILVASIFNAAPIDEKNTAPEAHARIMSRALSLRLSIASTI